MATVFGVDAWWALAGGLVLFAVGVWAWTKGRKGRK